MARGVHSLAASFDLTVNGSVLANEHLDTAQYFLIGDLNLNGAVDNADFSLLQGSYNNRVNQVPATGAFAVVDAVGTSSTVMTWGAVASTSTFTVAGYGVFRSTDGVDFSLKIGETIGANSTAFADHNLIDGTKYWYRARPFAQAGGTRTWGHTGPKAWAVTTLQPATHVTASAGDVTGLVSWRCASPTVEQFRVRVTRPADPADPSGEPILVSEEIARVGDARLTYHPDAASAPTGRYSWYTHGLTAGTSYQVTVTPERPSVDTSNPVATPTDFTTGGGMMMPDHPLNADEFTSEGFWSEEQAEIVFVSGEMTPSGMHKNGTWKAYFTTPYRHSHLEYHSDLDYGRLDSMGKVSIEIAGVTEPHTFDPVNQTHGNPPIAVVTTGALEIGSDGNPVGMGPWLDDAYNYVEHVGQIATVTFTATGFTSNDPHDWWLPTYYGRSMEFFLPIVEFGGIVDLNEYNRSEFAEVELKRTGAKHLWSKPLSTGALVTSAEPNNPSPATATEDDFEGGLTFAGLSIPAGDRARVWDVKSRDDALVEPAIEHVMARIPLSINYVRSAINTTVLSVGDDDFGPLTPTEVRYNDQLVRRDVADGQNVYAKGNAPHWHDHNGDRTVPDAGEMAAWQPIWDETLGTAPGEHSYPVSFERTTDSASGIGVQHITAFVKVWVTGNIAPGSTIRGESAEGDFVADPTTVIIWDDPASDKSYIRANLRCETPLDDVINHGLITVAWIVVKNKVGTLPTPVEFANSVNRIYITGVASPSAFHSVLGIACEGAAGMKPDNDNAVVSMQVANAVYSDFTNRSVIRREDEALLTYWGAGSATIASRTSTLLALQHGQCGAWAEILVKSFGVAGIPNVGPHENAKKMEVISAHTNDADLDMDSDGLRRGLMLVKAWEFDAVGNAPAVQNPFTHNYPAQINDLHGAPAQSNPNRISRFFNHFVVEYRGIVFDPSYGSPVFASREEWEHASLDGFVVSRAVPAAGGVPVQRRYAKMNANGLETVFTIEPMSE